MQQHITTMIKYSLSLIFFNLAVSLIQAQPYREMRGVWVATVSNIDFPKPGSTPEEQRNEWLSMLKTFKSAGINAVVVQIRPAADAIYPTALAPWSRFITGAEGLPPEPFYDPLRFMVQTAHDNHMEFHAWLNPYRATTNADTLLLAKNHVLKQHPHWIFRYAGRYYLNPAMPEVQKHITDIVEDIVSRYDVDAIHFDDYFYPYKVNNEPFNDFEDFKKYGLPNGYNDIAAWRRDNVTNLIRMVGAQLRITAPDVQFGISPFGVWRNIQTYPMGSDTRAGIQSYDDQHADIRLWLQEGLIDYVAPQNYWHIGFDRADYAKIVQWWSNNSYGQNLYMGQAVYKIANNTEAAWSQPDELPKQIALNRQTPSVEGGMLYNTSSLLKNPLGILDSMKKINTAPVIWPQHTRPGYRYPDGIEWRRIGHSNKQPVLQWKYRQTKFTESAKYFGVFRAPGKTDRVLQQGQLLAVVYGDTHLKYTDQTAEQGKTYSYLVVPYSKHHIAGENTGTRTQKTGAFFPWSNKDDDIEVIVEPGQPDATQPQAPAKKCGFFRRLFHKCPKTLPIKQTGDPRFF